MELPRYLVKEESTVIRFRCAFAPILFALLWAASPNPARADFIVVPGTADPWLAGMPTGATAGPIGETAGTTLNPLQSPVLAAGTGTLLPLTAGSALTFQVSGGPVGYGSGIARESGPNGMLYLGFLNVQHIAGATNGIGNYRGPINALLGVFLDNTSPSLSAAPATLDFSAPGATGFSTLSPALKQVFFIGDGLDSLANLRTIIVPQNATRLFLGVADGTEWANNHGSFDVAIGNSSGVASLPEPASLVLFAVGGLTALGYGARRRRPV